MRVIIDADACPVIDEIIEVTPSAIEIILIRSIDHFSLREYPPNVHVKYVDNGNDSADYAIVQTSVTSDIVVTQDYGLAALLIPKEISVLHHNGNVYTKENIDMLLEMRHTSQHLRKSGIRTKGPRKFTEEDRNKFKSVFQSFLERQI